MKNYLNQIIQGDSLEVLKTFTENSIDCCITSPPYWGLRDYGVTRQLGLEKTPEEYVNNLVEIFREVKRVLKKEGNCWLNLGDVYGGSGMGLSYSGFTRGPNSCDMRPLNMRPPIAYTRGKWDKQLLGIPWRVAFALQADGWYLRQDIIWHKPNPMPESVRDRCTKAHEYIFLLTKNKKYYFDNDSIKSPTKGNKQDKRARISRKRFPTKLVNGIRNTGYYPMANKRSVWTVNTKPFREAHFATFPEVLIEPMIKAGCLEGGIVLDIFMGAGTTAITAIKLNRNFIGIELNPEYVQMARKRIEAAKSV